MKRAFLIGCPVAHSLSPLLQNASFRAVGIECLYELSETPASELPRAIARVREHNCLGANVTIPHKQAVVRWLDDVGDSARKVGAVNTIVKHKGRLIGENTDVYGFARALADAKVELRGASVVILGAGGAARAVAIALAEGGVARIAILNRTPAHAQALQQALECHFPGLLVRVNQTAAIPAADLVVNATSVGMAPLVNETPMPQGVAWPRHAVAFDLIYRPAETRFMAEARAAGLKTIGGLGMLVHQGAAAFKLWTGREAPMQVSEQILTQAE